MNGRLEFCGQKDGIGVKKRKKMGVDENNYEEKKMGVGWIVD